MTPDLRVEFKFKNAVLYRALDACFGLEAQQRKVGHYPAPLARVAAEHMAVGYHELLEFVSLKRSPYSASVRYNGEPLPIAKRIAVQLGFDVFELFPRHLYALDLTGLQAAEFDSRLVGLDAAKSLPALGLGAEDVVFSGELNQAIEAVLSTLKPRERRIIELRFGIADGQEHTLEDIGRRVHCSAENVRRIEANVLRAMRLPKRRQSLSAFLGSRVVVKTQLAGDGE
jgi:RNA polymerase sigma factor (sigma-70 family)